MTGTLASSNPESTNLSEVHVGGDDPPPNAASEPTWNRLSPRMLLVHPVHELVQFFPALVGALVLGRTNDDMPWWFEPVFFVLPVLLGLLRWFTTSYRISETTLQLRTGLLQRNTLTAALDRIRTVDVIAPPLHRVLGLAQVKVGTAADTHFELNGLGAAHAGRLRVKLLHRRGHRPDRPEVDEQARKPSRPRESDGQDQDGQLSSVDLPGSGGRGSGDFDSAGTSDSVEKLIGRFNPTWVLLAPFTLNGLLVTAAIWGFIGQYTTVLIERLSRSELGAALAGHLEAVAVWLLVVEILLVAMTVLALLSMAGYLLSYWGYRLTRHPGGTLHVTRGLLTRRATSIEEARLRGAKLIEPYLMRMVHGARGSALTTGLDRLEQSSGAGDLLVPPAPGRYVSAVLSEVLGSSVPVHAPLRAHGAAARRRRHVRAAAAGVTGLGMAVVVVRFGAPSWVLLLGGLALVLAPVLAEQRYASLGHLVEEQTIVTRAGLFPRERSMLYREGVIGWAWRSTFFQRRAGLVTLLATTAAGGAVAFDDVPETEAVQLAATVSADVLAPVTCPPAGIRSVGTDTPG